MRSSGCRHLEIQSPTRKSFHVQGGPRLRSRKSLERCSSWANFQEKQESGSRCPFCLPGLPDVVNILEHMSTDRQRNPWRKDDASSARREVSALKYPYGKDSGEVPPEVPSYTHKELEQAFASLSTRAPQKTSRPTMRSQIELHMALQRAVLSAIRDASVHLTSGGILCASGTKRERVYSGGRICL